MSQIILHSYFRSSTSFRVRIALELKGPGYPYVTHHLRLGEHLENAYLEVNPQGLVPALIWTDGALITQSLAIMEFLDEVQPDPPLLPADPLGRARVRMLAQMIACDIHPINNLRVLTALRTEFGASDNDVTNWFRHWVNVTFGPLEMRWTRLVRQLGGLAKVDLVRFYAANRSVISAVAYTSSGVLPPKVECGRCRL